MSKISSLPVLDDVDVDGSEQVPAVKEGVTRRVSTSSLLAPWLDLIDLARDQAADLVLPEHIFVAADLATAQAAGEGAVADGVYFKAVGAAELTAQVRVRTPGGSDLLYEELTKAALAAAAAGKGAALVGVEGGGTAQDKLDALRGAISLMDAVYGVTGDGVTDDSAGVQAALDAACAAGKALFVPKGVYLLGTRQTAPDGYKVLVLVPTGCDVTIFGEGRESLFTIANNFTAGGDYSYFQSADSTTAHGNVEIYGIAIDGNGSNNLVIDSGVNVRRAYGIRLRTGIEAYIHDCFFSNMPGRNVVILGNNLSSPSWTVSRIVNNSFLDSGSAIAGNENQNDHSTLYVQAALSLVMGNTFRNTNTAFNPQASPAHACNAIEEHSRRALVIGNVVYNYGGGGNAVAGLYNTVSQLWQGNKFYGMKSNILKSYTQSAFTFDRLLIRDNILEVDNTTYNGASAFFQDTATATTGASIGFLSIEQNSIYCLSTTPNANSNFGILMCAADEFSIRGNEIKWFQGNGIYLTASAGTLGIGGGIIDANTLVNCGINSTVSHPYSIYVLQPDTNKVFARIKIGPDNTIVRDPQAVGATPLSTRGIRVAGPGNLQDIEVHTPRTRGIDRGSRVSFISTTLNKNVAQVPRTVVMLKTDTPTRGMFDIGGETIIHSDPTNGDNQGRIVTTAGSGSEATWASTTAYTVGQWIKTSASKVLECTVAGTSSSTEPAPTTLGAQYTDGTVTWLYRDAAVVVLNKFPVSGTISGTTDGSGDLTITHGFGATPSNIQVTVSGATYSVAQPNTIGASTFKIRFFDAAGAAQATTAVAGYWKVW